MAHLAALYPFHVDDGFGARGPYMGVNVTGGLSSFFFDPFELYGAGILTNPNVIVMGEIGAGKSAVVKVFLRRCLAVYGRERRFIAVIDPKGEYGTLADTLGLGVVRLHPGGPDRLNVMDPRIGTEPTNVLARQGLAASLVACVLGRPLDPVEDAVLGWAIHRLAATGTGFTLAEVTATVNDPGDELVTLARRSPLELAHAVTPLVFALDKLCSRTLRGMFDGPTTVDVDWDAGRGVVIDLSAVYHDRDALPLVLLAATAGLTGVLATHRTTRRIIQVVDEAWAAIRHGAHWFQGSLKFSRSYGMSTWLLCHNAANLTAQSDDGTADAKIAAGLLADIQTRVVLHQPADELARTADTLGLTEREAGYVGDLVRGRALWKINTRGAIVHNVLTANEAILFATDAAMTT
jgi:hypothetical protein